MLVHFSPKQYKDRIKKWGLNKHIQKDEMEAMIRIRRERKTTSNKETLFFLRGRPVNEEKIDRYEKEHPAETVADGDMDVDMDETSVPIPSDISFHTPKRAVSPTLQETPNSHIIPKPEAGAIPELTIPSSATPSEYLTSGTGGQPQEPWAHLQHPPPPLSQQNLQNQVTHR